MPQRSSIIKNQDVAAATFVVGSDLEVADFTTIQAALDALPAEGGSIYILEGTYTISTTITLPNKTVRFQGAAGSIASSASIISIGASTRGATTDDHIQIASQRNVVSGHVFDSVGGLTVKETGAADYNLVTGCNGISTGGGFSVPGVNSKVGADNIG